VLVGVLNADKNSHLILWNICTFTTPPVCWYPWDWVPFTLKILFMCYVGHLAFNLAKWYLREETMLSSESTAQLFWFYLLFIEFILVSTKREFTPQLFYVSFNKRSIRPWHGSSSYYNFIKLFYELTSQQSILKPRYRGVLRISRQYLPKTKGTARVNWKQD
jgi:hypothetical protein